MIVYEVGKMPRLFKREKLTVIEQTEQPIEETVQALLVQQQVDVELLKELGEGRTIARVPAPEQPIDRILEINHVHIAR